MPNIREAYIRHSAHYLEVLRQTNELYKRDREGFNQGIELFDSDLANIRAAQEWTEKNAKTDSYAATLCLDFPLAFYCLNLRLHPREQIRWLESAIASAQKMKKKDIEGTHLGNLGVTYIYLGETYHAIELFKRHLEIARETGHRGGEANALGNLGFTYITLGDGHQAIEFLEQCLTIHREIGDRRGEGNSLGNIGFAYSIFGEYTRAIEFLGQNLTICREIGDRRGEGQVLATLGLTYLKLGEPSFAIDFSKQALIIAREIGDRHSEGTALWNMSLASDKLDKNPEAIAYAEAVLSIYEEIDNPDAAKVRQQLIAWQRNRVEK